MNYKHLMTALFWLVLSTAFAQKSPPGINYQAVARDAKGLVLTNKDISLQVSLYTGEAGGKGTYSEVHRIRTNELGLFSLVVGRGYAVSGDFLQVPWSTMNVWMELAIDESGGNNFKVINASQLMAVPYAFHAGSASDLILEDQGQEKASCQHTGLPFWTTKGNSNVREDCHFIGTTIHEDFVFKTNNIERMRITADGEIIMAGSLTIIDDIHVGRDAFVGRNVSVGNDLDVDGDANIDRNLTVRENLTVDGLLNFTNTTQSTTKDNGAVVIEGGVGIEKNLNIGGTFSAKGSNTGFMATIDNADGNDGDGLEIKLGRTHPAWNGSDYLHLTSPAADIFDGAIGTVTGWIDGESFSGDQLLTFIPSAYIAGTACNLVNLIGDQLSTALSLPLDFPELTILPETEIFGGIDLDVLGSIPALTIPELTIPSFELIPEIPALPCDALPSFTLPVLSIVDVDNSLTKENQFISFKDKDNRELGSIRAQSVSNWRADYLDETRIVDFMSGMIGLDFVQGIVQVFNAFTAIADSHNSIGVEYASGHGDYAEWLERIHTNEAINAGDIVAVMGGKITKDLSKAEQVMVVSHKPIVLGNTPPAEREALGNKIAFMGQVPVKVQGPVQAGDYIVGNPSTPGYGIAVAPAEMTAEKARLTVGRSWESKTMEGPKMVNTVIGVDNGNFLKVIQDNQNQVSELDARVKALEAKMDALLNATPNSLEASKPSGKAGKRK